jgi:DNA repair exonuclease SbcCD nuclease subunit
LISGDLFDSNRPGQSTVDHVVHRSGEPRSV